MGPDLNQAWPMWKHGEVIRAHPLWVEQAPDTEGWWSRLTQLSHLWEDATRKSSLDTGPCVSDVSHHVDWTPEVNSLWEEALLYVAVLGCFLPCSREVHKSKAAHLTVASYQEAGRGEYWNLPSFLSSFNSTAQSQPKRWCHSPSGWIICHQWNLSGHSL